MRQIKSFMLIILLPFLPVAVYAQDYWSGVGVKIGNNFGVDYKIFVNETQAVELGVGMLDPFSEIGPQMLLFSPKYEFHFGVGIDGLKLYAGPGISAGVQFGNQSELLKDDVSFFLSADAVLGIEYKISSLPLAVTFAWSPKLQFLGDYRLVEEENVLPTDWEKQRRISFRFSDISIGIRYTF